MTKYEFIDALREELSSLPREDVEERLAFYSEMIDDRIEDGLSEADAVREIGTVEKVAAEIISSIPLTRIVKNKIKKKQRFRTWEIVLLILGSPIWLSLLIAAFAVAFSLYAVLWSIIVVLWASFAGLLASGTAMLPVGVILAVNSAVPTGIAFIGIGLFAVGLSIFFFFGCKYATLGVVWLTKKIFLGIKKAFVGKENAR